MESTSSAGSRAPYGRACTNCSHVKCRCIYKSNEAICERCRRLKKHCLPTTSVRQRIKKPPTSRVAKLEEKLDGLVSLLRSQVTVSSPQSGIFDTSSALPTPNTQVSIPTPDSNVDLLLSLISNDGSISGISKETAEKNLNTFRHAFLPFFPFVHILETITASDLRLQKPFLWLVIMSLTTKSAVQQLAMGDNILEIVSKKVVAEHEKSLDLLLGLICYLAWFHYHKKHKPYLIMWTQLAVALVFELGIHKAGSRDVGQVSSKAECSLPRILAGPTRSMEERRAVLGVFVISSIMWTSLRQMETLRWTPYMDDCVRVLAEKNETELDFLLIHQAKCYVTVDQMTRPSTEWTTDGEEPRPPAAYFVKVMQRQLQDIRQSLPVEMQSARIALFSLYGTEIIGKEALLQKPKVRDQTDLRRLEGLDSLLTAIERWFEVFHQMPLADWIGIPFAVFDQFSHCLKLLFRLTTLHEPDWDTEEVKKRIDMLDILERLANDFERLPDAAGLVDDIGTGESSVFFKAPPVIRAMKAKFVAEINPATMETGDNLVDFEVLEDFAMYLADDSWLLDMFVPLREFDIPQ